jgi:DNA-directed RNA polymerase subunit RPC12/RpoP
MAEKTEYVCINCGAEDSDRTSTPYEALICWKCRAGRGMKMSEQVMRGVGMLPKRVVEQFLAAQP